MCRMMCSTSSGIEDEFYGEVMETSYLKSSSLRCSEIVCVVSCDGFAIKSKAFAAKAKKENKYTDDCVFDLGYVEGRGQLNIVK